MIINKYTKQPKVSKESLNKSTNKLLDEIFKLLKQASLHGIKLQKVLSLKIKI